VGETPDASSPVTPAPDTEPQPTTPPDAGAAPEPQAPGHSARAADRPADDPASRTAGRSAGQAQAGRLADVLAGFRAGGGCRCPRSRAARAGARLLGPARPGHKLDAIDTDQITPAADCVSESLAALDERWKAGSFRHLMPDFRARVHAGETFVVAGDRFAIGSSREMSPAGLQAVAQEAGLEMVIVCGDNMGDIFRRNALNLGLHVVQSRPASRTRRTATS